MVSNLASTNAPHLLLLAALFWTKVGAIGQVAGAVATFAAVVVALYLGTSERRFRLRVTARFAQIIDVQGATQVVTIEVENIGLRTARITGFGWSTGFVNSIRILPKWLRLKGAFQMPDYEWAINPPFPWVLEPGESRCTHIRRGDFLEGFRPARENDLFRRLPLSRRYRLLRHRVTVGVYTRKRSWFGKVDKKLTKALEEGYELNQPAKYEQVKD